MVQKRVVQTLAILRLIGWLWWIDRQWSTVIIGQAEKQIFQVHRP